MRTHRWIAVLSLVLGAGTITIPELAQARLGQSSTIKEVNSNWDNMQQGTFDADNVQKLHFNREYASCLKNASKKSSSRKFRNTPYTIDRGYRYNRFGKSITLKAAPKCPTPKNHTCEEIKKTYMCFVEFKETLDKEMSECSQAAKNNNKSVKKTCKRERSRLKDFVNRKENEVMKCSKKASAPCMSEEEHALEEHMEAPHPEFPYEMEDAFSDDPGDVDDGDSDDKDEDISMGDEDENGLENSSENSEEPKVVAPPISSVGAAGGAGHAESVGSMRSLDLSQNSTNIAPAGKPIVKKGYGEGFLWKPKSESNGKLVVLLPKRYRGFVRNLRIVNECNEDFDECKFLESGQFKGDTHNGWRPHFYFSKPGSSYKDIYVQMTFVNGQKVLWHIPDGAKRYE